MIKGGSCKSAARYGWVLNGSQKSTATSFMRGKFYLNNIIMICQVILQLQKNLIGQLVLICSCRYSRSILFLYSQQIKYFKLSTRLQLIVVINFLKNINTREGLSSQHSIHNQGIHIKIVVLDYENTKYVGIQFSMVVECFCRCF